MLATGDLLERDGERLEIRGALTAASAGAGRLVLVEGAAGSGKSALLADARDAAAEQGLQVLSATGGELERDFPFGCVRQLFEPLLRAAPDTERAALLSGAAAPAGWIADQGRVAPPTDPFGALNALYWLAANTADRGPLALVVDDAHWADDGSIRALGHLARRLGDLPVALIVGLRPDEPGAPEALIDDLRTVAGATRLTTRPLSEVAVAALVRTADPTADDATCRACHATSAGNPLYLRELLRTAGEDGLGGPERVTAATVPTLAARVARRVAKVSPDAPALAVAMAVLGDGGALDAAADLAGIDQADAARIARRLRQIEVLATDDPFAFVHPLVRRSIYDGLSVAERDAAHAAAAAQLLDAPEARAAHLAALRPTGSELVIDGLLAAARSAAARAAPEAAVRLLRRALEEGATGPARAALLFELGRAELAVRDPSALEHLSLAIAETNDIRLRVAATLTLADGLVAAGRWAEVRSLDLAGLAAQTEDVGLVTDIELIRTGIAVNDPHMVGEFVRDRARIEQLAEGPGWSAHALRALLAAQVALRGEDADAAEVLVDQALRDDVLLGDGSGGGWLGAQPVMALVSVERYDRALEVIDELERHGRTVGSLLTQFGPPTFRAWVADRRGDLPTAAAEARPGFDVAVATGMAMWVTSVVYTVVDTLLERPDLGDIAALVETIELEPAYLGTVGGALLLHTRGRLRHAHGDRRRAFEDLRASAETFSALGIGPGHVGWRSALALALSPADHDAAVALAEEEAALARRTGLPRALGVALRASGLLGGNGAGIATLRESVDVLQRSPARLEHARSLVALGSALRRGGQRVEARTHLTAGLELAWRCGADALVASAQEELRAAGGRPRRIVRSGVEALTASELRIARLAAAGRSNVEIAQQLFVTVKTVETHLSHAYAKLGLGGQGARARVAETLKFGVAP